MADKKQEVFDEDLIAILHDEIHPVPGNLPARLPAYLQRHVGHPHGDRAACAWRETREGAAIGDGPVDAVCKAISAVTKTRQTARYEIRAVTSGTEAMGEVTVQLEEGGCRVVGRGASTDVIEASAKAYIDGLNKLASLRSKPGE